MYTFRSRANNKTRHFGGLYIYWPNSGRLGSRYSVCCGTSRGDHAFTITYVLSARDFRVEGIPFTFVGEQVSASRSNFFQVLLCAT